MKRVLIAESQPSLAGLISHAAEQAGYEPHLCYSIASALTAAPSMGAEIHIVNAMLSDGLGFQLARAIRRHPNLYKSGVLMTALSIEPPDAEHARAQGVDEIMTLPLVGADFGHTIHAMERRQEHIRSRCPQTGLGLVEGLKREINHRLFRGEDVGLCYVIPRGLSRLRDAGELDRLHEIAREAGRVIRDTIVNTGFYETFACHLGSANFAIMVGPDDCQRLLKAIAERFGVAYTAAREKGVLPSPSIRAGSVRSTTHRRYQSAHEMLSDIQRMQSMDDTRRLKASSRA